MVMTVNFMVVIQYGDAITITVTLQHRVLTVQYRWFYSCKMVYMECTVIKTILTDLK